MTWLSGLPSTLRTSYLSDMRLLDSGFVRFWALIALVAALLLPLALTSFWTGVANQAFIAIIGALALMVVVTWHLGRAAIIDVTTGALALLSLIALIRFKINATWLILAGATTIGTQAAVDYVCQQDSLEQLLLRLSVSNSGELKPFEAVIRVKVTKGVPVESELVALRKGPA